MNGETERPRDFPKGTAQDRADVGPRTGARKEEQVGVRESAEMGRGRGDVG